MASTASLRTRRSAAQLHALAGVEREIRANDPNSRRKYLLDFSQAFRSYGAVLEKTRVAELVEQADVVLVGDYHALPNCQKFAAELIAQLGKSGERPLVVGLETVFARDQHILDEWLAGEIDDDELRERIRFDLDWGYSWGPFYELLESTRTHARAVYGLDCMPREDLRKIGARDRHAAAKISEIRHKHADSRIVILFGESHLAPNHLPQLLGDKLPGERILTVLQNVDALYWRAAGESCDRVEAVQAAENVICVFNSTPLEKYENYRLCLDRWRREGLGSPDLAPTIYNLIDGLLRFLGIHLYSPHNSTQPKFLVDSLPEVCCRHSDSRLRRLLASKSVTEDEKRILAKRVEECGSAYLPHANTIYIREFHMMHAAEHASRFLHHACRGLPLRGPAPAFSNGEDAFYTRTLEYALAYFGSRVLYPARPPARESALYELYDQTREDVEQSSEFSFPEFIGMVDFLALHRGYELNPDRYSEPPGPIQIAMHYSPEKLDYCARQLGYMLGTDLYDAYLEGKAKPRFLKKLFLIHLEEPGIAAATYFTVVKKIRRTKRRATAASR
jgi:heme-binding uptake protein ChaN (Tiki superfamily)